MSKAPAGSDLNSGMLKESYSLIASGQRVDGRNRSGWSSYFYPRRESEGGGGEEGIVGELKELQSLRSALT